jgi:hypothetical protein
MACKEAKFWKRAEQKEIKSLREKNIFGKLKMTPPGRKAVKSRWVYSMTTITW